MYSQLATAGVVSPGKDPADEPAAGSAVAADTAAESSAMFLAFADELIKRRKRGDDVSCVVLFSLPKIPALRAVLMQLLERVDRRKSCVCWIRTLLVALWRDADAAWRRADGRVYFMVP